MDQIKPRLIKDIPHEIIESVEGRLVAFIKNYVNYGEYFYSIFCKDQNNKTVIVCFDLSNFISTKDYSIGLKLFCSESIPSWASLGYQQDVERGWMNIFDIRCHQRRTGHGSIILKCIPLICEIMNQIIEAKNVDLLNLYKKKNWLVSEEYPKFMKVIQYIKGDIKTDGSISEDGLLAFYRKNNCLVDNKVYMSL